MSKCKSCIGRYEYKTSLSCRYCKYNTEPYLGRDESKMIKDGYRYVPPKDTNDNIPF